MQLERDSTNCMINTVLIEGNKPYSGSANAFFVWKWLRAYSCIKKSLIFMKSISVSNTWFYRLSFDFVLLLRPDLINDQLNLGPTLIPWLTSANNTHCLDFSLIGGSYNDMHHCDSCGDEPNKCEDRQNEWHFACQLSQPDRYLFGALNWRHCELQWLQILR